MSSLSIDSDLLISCVKSRPCLWNKYHEDYKDRVKIRNNWKHVCCMLLKDFEQLNDADRNAFGQAVLKKWTNIRDSYRKCLRQMEQQNSGEKASSSRKYCYYEQLRFLKKIFDEKQNDDTGPDEMSETYEDDRSRSSNSCFLLSTRLPDKQTSAKKRKKTDEEDEKMKNFENEWPEDHAHLSFFKGLLSTTKDFSADETIDLQIGVLKVIRNIKRRRKNPYLSFSPQIITPSPEFPMPVQPFIQSSSHQQPPNYHFLYSQSASPESKMFSESHSSASQDLNPNQSSRSYTPNPPGTNVTPH